MENICRYGAFQNAVELIKENMEFQHLVFRFLKVVCSTSPYLVVMFHNISGLHLIKQALETEEKNISENHTFLTETIQLIDVLIPNKSLNDVFGKELDEIYRLSPDLLRNLGEMTLPRLVKIYDKILNKNLKNSILLVIGKLFSVAETDAIINYINHPHFSAFLFGVFRSKEQEVLRSGLKLVMLLYEKCPVQIAESFVRDGIIYKIQNLKNQEKTQIESPIKEKPRLIRSNAMRDSGDLITLESQDYKRYRNFRRSYMVYKENEDNKMMIPLPKDMIDMINTIISKSQSFEKPDFFNILNQLKTISRSLNDTENDCSTALVKFRELMNTKESISLYEFINSEFIEALYKWLTNGYKKNPVLVSKRIYEFMSLFLENSSAGISYLNGLITLLLKSIRYSQEFSILLYETIAGFSNSFHAMRTLGSRVRIKLVYSPDGYQSNPDCLELENKHKLFSSIGAVSLSLEQFVSLETITDALLNVKTLESIEFLTESFENSNNEPKHLNPDQFNMIRQHLKMQLVLSESSDLNSALEDMGIRSEGNEHLIDEIQTQKRLIDNKDIEEDMIDIDQPIEAMNISTQKSSRFDEAKLRVLFKINGTHLHKKMTLFEIINKHEIDETLTINFQFTLEKNKENENSTYVMSGNGVLDEIIKNSRLLMIEADNKAYPALRLLKLLYLLNQNLRYIMSPCSILFPFPVSLSLHPNLDRANFTSHKLSSLISKQTSDMLAMIGGMAPD